MSINVIKGWLILPLVLLFFLLSCGEDDAPTTDESGSNKPIASFQKEIDDEDFLKVDFDNFSKNSTSYSWDFGDGSETSTEKNPTYRYQKAGTYDVVLIAKNETGESDDFKESITLSDPLAAQRTLVGSDGKIWQMIADVSNGLYPYEVAPKDGSDIWWQLTGNNDPNKDLCYRNCIFDDIWTFKPDGTYLYDNKGSFYAEGGIFKQEVADLGCFDATDNANWQGPEGQDLSGWNSGTHSFSYDAVKAKLTITGGFIGLNKVGTDQEVMVPQSSIVYDVVKLVDSTVDTLILRTSFDVDGTAAYWQFVLVSYDEAAEKVVINECAPVTEVEVTFKLNMNKYESAYTTPYLSGTFNGWSGDANPLTDDNQDGIWETTITLNAETAYEYKFQVDGWNAEESLSEGSTCTVTNNGFTNRSLKTETTDIVQSVVCWNSCDNCSTDVSSVDLVGSWKMIPEEKAMGVGPNQGDISWWSNTIEDVTTRACYFDDIWTFDDKGGFSIQMDGETWVEAWQVSGVDGCAAPVAPFDGSGTYTYTATETSLTLNGKGAFIGLAKVTNDGEINNLANAPDVVTYTISEFSAGVTKKLTLDINFGGGWWRFILVSQ